MSKGWLRGQAGWAISVYPGSIWQQWYGRILKTRTVGAGTASTGSLFHLLNTLGLKTAPPIFVNEVLCLSRVTRFLSALHSIIRSAWSILKDDERVF